VFNPFTLPFLAAAGPYWASTLQIFFHGGVAATGVWALARRLGAGPAPAMVGGLAFAFSPLMVGLSCEPPPFEAAAWSGWMVWAAHGLSGRKAWRLLPPLSAFFALSLLSGAPETSLWQGLFAACAAVWWGGRKAAVRAGLALLAGGGVAAVALLPAAEFIAHSGRVAGMASLGWSTSWSQLLSVVLPNADVPRDTTYWGSEQRLLVPCFAGSLVALFAVSARLRGRRALPFAVAGLLLAALALGAHFAPAAWFLQWGPFRLSRFPVKYLLGTAFSLAVLTSLGLQRLSRARSLARGLRALPVPVLAVAAFLAAGVDWARSGAARGAVWCLVWSAAAAGVWAISRRGRTSAQRASLLAGVCGAELVVAACTFVPLAFLPPRALAGAASLATYLREHHAGRLSIQGEAAPAVEANAAAPVQDAEREILRRTQNLEAITYVASDLEAIGGDGAIAPAHSARLAACDARACRDLLGVSDYVDTQAPFPDAREVSFPGLRSLYETTTAYPRAFLTQSSVVASDDAALAALAAPDTPSRRTAFLSAGENLASPCVSPTPALRRGGPNRLEIDLDACAEQYLVVAESDFPGWRARLDGTEVPIVRTDVALRGIRVPAGHHHLDLRYFPLSFAVGAAVSLLSISALALCVRRQRIGAQRSV
jgi:hypothetical protein